MRVLKLLDDKLEEYIMVVLTILMTALIVLQVIMRYIFNNSLAWTEELSRYVFLWAIWIGASYGVKIRTHVRLTILTSKFGPRGQEIVGVFAYVVWLLFEIFLVVEGYILVASVRETGQTSTALHLPMWIAYASVPVGCTLMTIRLIQNGYYTLRDRKKAKEEKEAD